MMASKQGITDSVTKYVQSIFTPRVAILASKDSDNICLKNNLRFVDIVQPFIKSYPEG